jgi:hypothetical protein
VCPASGGDIRLRRRQRPRARHRLCGPTSAASADGEDGLTPPSVLDSNVLDPTRGEQVAITGLLPSVFSRQSHSARTTLRTRPPPPPTSALKYTPARSADRHRLEAHWRHPSILSPAVTATGATRQRPYRALAGRGMGRENPLAGDGFRATGSPISHRGDHGAAYHEEPESEGENPGRTKGFYRAEGWSREGYPHRSIEADRRRERTIEENVPVQHWRRCRST